MVDRRQFLAHGVVGILAAAVPGAAKSRSAPTVQTVLGPVATSKLGFTLTHEHVCACTPEFWSQWPGTRADLVARAAAELRAARRAGVRTLVDLSPYDGGRDIRLIAAVARESGMQIVACTGQHLFAPPGLRDRGVDELTDLFVGEIERGIDGTEIRAGIIKVATAATDPTEIERRALRAAARASKATGVPIATHTHARVRGGERQAEILEAEGVDPARVSLGHSDDSGDADYLLGLARRGYTLGMDHTNRGVKSDATVPLRRRLEIIRQIIDAGCVDRLFLSNDVVLGTALLPAELHGEREKNNPDGMLFNTRRAIPLLREMGVSDRDIRRITVDNPRRFLAAD